MQLRQFKSKRGKETKFKPQENSELIQSESVLKEVKTTKIKHCAALRLQNLQGCFGSGLCVFTPEMSLLSTPIFQMGLKIRFLGNNRLYKPIWENGQKEFSSSGVFWEIW